MNDAEKLAYLQKHVAAMLGGAYYVTHWGSGKSQITLDRDGSEAFLKLRVLEACNELGPSEPLPSHLQEMADQGREVMTARDEPTPEPGSCGLPTCPVLHEDPADPIHPYELYGPGEWTPDTYLGRFGGTWSDLMDELGSGNLHRVHDVSPGVVRIMVRDASRVDTSRLHLEPDDG